MALQNFVDKVGPVVSAAWLNAVDKLKFTIFADAETKAAARTALTSDAPLEVVNGGTGARTPAEARTNLGITLGSVSWPATDFEIAQGVTVVNSNYPPFNVNRYGASSDASAATNVTAFQAAFNLAHAAQGDATSGGGTVEAVAGESYNINAALVLGSFTTFDGKECQIIQNADDTPVFKLTKAAFNQHITIRDVNIVYATQQLYTQTQSYGIQLSTANVMTWMVTIDNVQVWKGAGAVVLPEDTECHAFLVKCNQVVASDNATWGFDIKGALTGARTNFVFQNCWCVPATGAEPPQSAGFRVKRTHGLLMDNCGCDHVQQKDILYLETTQGSIGTFWAESCDITSPSGYGAGSFFTFSQCVISIDYLYLDNNTVTLDDGTAFFAIRCMDGTTLHLKAFHDYITNFVAGLSGSTGRTRNVVYCDSISTMTNDFYASGTPIGLGGNKLGTIVDFNNQVGVKRWNNVSLEYNVLDTAHSNAALIGGMGPSALNISFRWSKSGNNVTLRWGYNISGTGQGTHIGISGLPTFLNPRVSQRTVAFVYSTNTSPYQRLGMVEIMTTGEIRIYSDLEGNTFPVGFTCGVLDTVITYSLVGDVAPDEVV